MIAQDLKSALEEVCPELQERETLDWPAFNCPIASLFELIKTLRDNHDRQRNGSVTEIYGRLPPLLLQES